MNRISRTHAAGRKLAGFAVIAATATLPLLAVPALAQSPAASPASPTSPAMPGAKPMTPADKTPGHMATNGSADTMSEAGGVRASKIIGAGVTNEQKETVGTVEDLIITDNEKVPTAVLSVGGFLGIGTKYVAVPFSDLKVADGKVMMSGATKESLKALPSFKYAS